MQSLRFLFAIELDDNSHQKKHRQKRDAFVNKLFQDNNLPLLRISTKSNYNTERIKSKTDYFYSKTAPYSASLNTYVKRSDISRFCSHMLK
jgi:hypothetical protein